MPEAGSHEKRGSMLQTVDNNDIKNSLAAMIQKNKITKQKTIKEDVVEEEKQKIKFGIFNSDDEEEEDYKPVVKPSNSSIPALDNVSILTL